MTISKRDTDKPMLDEVLRRIAEYPSEAESEASTCRQEEWKKAIEVEYSGGAGLLRRADIWLGRQRPQKEDSPSC